MYSLTMNVNNAFKKTILLHFLILIVSIIASFYHPDQVIEANERFETKWFEDNEGAWWAAFIIALVLIAAYFYSLYAMYKFKSYGKKLYIYLLIFFTLLNLVLGNVAFSALEITLYEISLMLNGALVIFLYFTPIKQKFD